MVSPVRAVSTAFWIVAKGFASVPSPVVLLPVVATHRAVRLAFWTSRMTSISAQRPPDVARTTKLYVPAVGGVPEILPVVALIVSQSGLVPMMDHA